MAFRWSSVSGFSSMPASASFFLSRSIASSYELFGASDMLSLYHFWGAVRHNKGARVPCCRVPCRVASVRKDAMKRREALVTLVGGVAGLVSQAQAHAAPGTPAAIGASDGELVYVGRDPVRIKLGSHGARGPFGMITQEVSPGTTIPVHLHEREDELIFIQSGEGEATLGEQVVKLAAGSTLFVPRGTWHGGRNTGPAVLNWIAIYAPSGF